MFPRVQDRSLTVILFRRKSKKIAYYLIKSWSKLKKNLILAVIGKKLMMLSKINGYLYNLLLY